jgi:hypothetical protein
MDEQPTPGLSSTVIEDPDDPQKHIVRLTLTAEDGTFTSVDVPPEQAAEFANRLNDSATEAARLGR